MKHKIFKFAWVTNALNLNDFSNLTAVEQMQVKQSFKCFNFFAWIICFLGLVIHLYQIFAEFFQYPILTRIKIDPVEPEIPAIALCPSTWRSKFVKSSLMKATVYKRAIKTPGPEKYIKSCTFQLSTGSSINCTSATQIVQYIGPMGKCFVLFQQRPLGPSINVSHQFNFQISLKSPFPDPKRWLVKVFPPPQPFVFHRKQRSKLMYEPSLDRLVTLEAKLEGKIQLPPPYHDGCFNYSATIYKTRDKAIHDCLLREYRNQTSKKSYFYQYNFVQVKQLNSSNLAHPDNLEVRSSLFPGVHRRCNHLFAKNDCYKVEYPLSFKTKSQKITKK